MEDNNIQDSCCNSKYASIRQMEKLDEVSGRRFPFYPRTVIQAVHDGRTGAPLEAILAQYNNIYVQFQGTAVRTRNIVPKEMRRKGIIISYVDMLGNAITEKCVNDAQRDNFHWGLDVNWVRVDELTLSGDISISVKGTWVINGEDTGIAALGPKGDNGLTPWLKTIDNKLYFSYDNETWEVCSDYIAAYFRFQDNKFQISRDNKTWSDLSGEVTNSLYIKAYVTDKSQYPNPKQGDMIMVGPTYAADDTEHTKPIYRLHVYNANEWVDNGLFQSIAAGVVQELGDSETEGISQKIVSEKFSELDARIEFSDISIQDEAIIGIGEVNKIIRINKTLFEKGKVKITVDKSNFPSDISYNGCQIRDNNGIEKYTKVSEEFEIDSFASIGYFTIGFYFYQAVQSEVIIPYSIKVLYGSPYEEETRVMVNKNNEDNSNFIPSYGSHIYNYTLINMYIGSNGNWQRFVGKGKSLLIPADNIKKLYVIGNEIHTSSIYQLTADLNIKSEQVANVTEGTEFINLTLKEYKVIEIAQNTKYISIIINDGNGNDRSPYYIGVEYIKNENNQTYKELIDYNDYEETIQGALIGNDYWWQNDATAGCEIVKINIEGYNKIKILSNRGATTISGAILKDNATQTNNTPLPFADGISERFMFSDTIPHEIELPYNAKYMYINAKISDGDIIIPYVQLIKDQTVTINRLNKKIQETNYYNIGKETITKRFENFGNYEIVGITPTLSIVRDSSGNYDTPPIEISGGIITNVSVIEDGGATEKPAYCVHSDRDNNIENKIVVDNCIFDSNSNACWGVGTRKKYEMIFRHCVFIQRATVDDPAISGDTHSWYSHNTTSNEVLTKEHKSIIRFWKCIFISDTGEPMYLQDWSVNDSDDKIDFCEFEFIGCNFAWKGNTEDAVKIDYKGGVPELNSKEFKRHLILSDKSTGNNVSWLNA